MECFAIKIKQLEFASLEYEEMLRLRSKVLREPLGRCLDALDLEGEDRQLHFGLVSAENGQLLACLCVREIDSTHYKIRQMAVDEQFQGARLGSRLMQEVELALRQRGGMRIELNARTTATGFYEKLGYECMGKIFDEIGIPHIKMHKDF